MIEGYWGPLIRTVSSIDSSIELQPTQPGTYTSITKTTSFRYNKKKYYWFLNNYLYFPDLEWDAVRVEAVFDDDISAWLCEGDEDACVPRYEQELKIPDFLLAEIESQILNIMFNTLKVPMEDSDNKLNPHR